MQRVDQDKTRGGATGDACRHIPDDTQPGHGEDIAYAHRDIELRVVGNTDHIRESSAFVRHRECD